MKNVLPILTFAALLAFTAQIATAQDAVIETIPVTDGIHMLMGPGGNLAVLTGDQGAIVVDDKFAEQSDAILAAIAALTDQSVQFVINTHWHGDHTGGNENMAATGAIIVAHENVRARMSTDQFMAAFNNTVPAAAEAAWPVVTFTDRVNFHWNGEDVTVFHVDPAHTDGDALVHFATSNVIHMGDTYFNGMYPFIDVSSGGSLDGIIAAVDLVLGKVDDNTKIIPGHGALSNKAELVTYRKVLAAVRDGVSKMIAEGKTAEQVISAKPTAQWDDSWGMGFMKPDVFLGIVYASLSAK